jgi:hypothetical protein
MASPMNAASEAILCSRRSPISPSSSPKMAAKSGSLSRSVRLGLTCCNLAPTSPRTWDSPPDTGETQRAGRGCNAQGLASCGGISGQWGQRRQRANKRPVLTPCSSQPRAAKSISWRRGQSIVSVARCSILVGFLGELNAADAISTQAAGRRYYKASGAPSFPDARRVRGVRTRDHQGSEQTPSGKDPARKPAQDADCPRLFTLRAGLDRRGSGPLPSDDSKRWIKGRPKSRRITVRCRFTANGNTIRSRRKPRGSPCSISDRVEGCGAACSGVSSTTHVRTGDTKR